MKIKIKKLNSDSTIPFYAHIGDAGMDLYSCEDYILKSGERHLFKLSIAAEFPEGYVVLIWDKSGLAAKHGLTVLAGVIDHSYRGEYGVVLLNTSDQDYEIKRGNKIAQLLIQKVEQAEVEEVQELSDTERGEGGFGSTGK
jgi:dUTP pyrophosphatase